MAHDSSVQHSSAQRISRLTPLSAVRAAIASQVSAVAPETCASTAARNATLAQDVTLATLPSQAIALRDGYAVEAAVIADASSYAPIQLASGARRIDAGEALPPGTDTIAPLDAIVMRGDHAEAIASVTPGDGVLPVGGDAAGVLFRTGRRLHALDIAVLNAAGVKDVGIRVPRLRLAYGSAAKTPPLDAALAFVAKLIVKAGGAMAGEAVSLADAFGDRTADAIVALGGTGSGRSDDAVSALAQRGRVIAHGIAISPGETAAFGFVDKRPVLLIPGRLDAALAVWLLLGRVLVAQLAGGTADDAAAAMPLKRKVTSTIGLTELVPVKAAGGMAEPLGSGYLSLSMLAESDGYLVVPADSEGFAAGTQIAVRPWP